LDVTIGGPPPIRGITEFATGGFDGGERVDDHAADAEAAGADPIERVFRRVPRLIVEVDHIDGGTPAFRNGT
jgi:hypothetical protein